MVSRRHRREDLLDRDRNMIASAPALDRAFLTPVRLPAVSLNSVVHDESTRDIVRQLDDGRFFSPFASSSAGSPLKSDRSIVERPVFQGRMSFNKPRFVTVCVRRKERREVLFAKGRTGKGAHRRKRFNQWSKIKC